MKLANTEFEIIEADNNIHYQSAIKLFKEYASELGFDLSFQNFDKELHNLNTMYGRPNGCLLLVKNNQNIIIGCAGIRRFENNICELKRMFIKKEGRGLGIGKALLEKAIEVAKELNYAFIRLDTIASMQTAIKLYTQAGFTEIGSYRYNPIEGARYFEKKLN
ncbi:GNAT family N-acetyltransferase [Chondrinema litorale]|uniref:GNAT family N-acetyltransferase n=1 Tax=Chondrinema litorale TaxID=2994555 RepID=UPI0025432F4E|nr:GNAT family N-acetyltransferase [Chondrinema litorale]UZR96078.1 GNAT family N-acetyltransferase [Chondrinema litorale]